jgi:hypothetical protein
VPIGEFHRLFPIPAAKFSNAPQRREPNESLAKSLDAPAFLIHCQEQTRITDVPNRLHQGVELRPAFEIAAKKHHAADQGMRELRA